MNNFFRNTVGFLVCVPMLLTGILFAPESYLPQEQAENEWVIVFDSINSGFMQENLEALEALVLHKGGTTADFELLIASFEFFVQQSSYSRMPSRGLPRSHTFNFTFSPGDLIPTYLAYGHDAAQDMVHDMLEQSELWQAYTRDGRSVQSIQAYHTATFVADLWNLLNLPYSREFNGMIGGNWYSGTVHYGNTFFFADMPFSRDYSGWVSRPVQPPLWP